MGYENFGLPKVRLLENSIDVEKKDS